MATRMQQRRGTAAQWTSANPVLNAGEMGWESDTNKFKIGDGTNHWADIDYFADINSTVNPAFGTSIVFEGATADSYETTLQVTDPTADRTITFPDNSGTVALTTDIAAGTVTENATQTLTNKTLTSPVVSGLTISDGSIIVEGTTADDFETTLVFTDPTADRTITFPNNSGTVAFTSDISAATGGSVSETGTQTLTNKTISLTNNTITGTLAEFNTALSDANFASETQLDSKLNLTDPALDYYVTNSGSGAYLVNGVSNGTIYFEKGKKYRIHVNATGHPFWIQTVSGAYSSGNVYSTGITGNGTQSGHIIVELAQDAPQLYYACQYHSSMAGSIDIGSSASNLTVTGNLTVNGTTTNINSTNLVVEDKNIVLGDTAEPADATADGGGITLKGTTDKTFNWVDATDAWTSSEHINLASGKSLYLNGTLLKDVTETFTNKTLESAIATTALTLNAAGELRLADSDSSHYVGFKSPSTVSTNRIWTLPAADGSAGQVLTTDGSGTFSFSTPAAGAAFSELMLIGA